jgi:quercetin dioxygenase-like cupin family protein
MHFTDSIDFDMYIAGEMILILETEEIVLKPGDVVYLPQLQHAWRTETGGTFAFLMISPHPS